MKRKPKYHSNGNAVVIGLGKSGVACANFLINDGWNVQVCDVVSRPHLESRFKSTMPGIPVEAPDPNLFFNTDLVAMSCTSANSNKNLTEQASQYGALVLSSLDLFFKYCKKPTIAVSGTNGKSTVTTIINNVVKKSGKHASIGGCRGVPVLDLLNADSADIYLLELSAVNLEQVKSSIEPDVASLLNSYPDYLERYKNEKAYKSTLEKSVQSARIAVLNRDDALLHEIKPAGQSITFGRDSAPSQHDFGILTNKSGRWIARGQEPLVNLTKCKLKGPHNEQNLLAACAVLSAAGYDVQATANEFYQFQGLQYRFEVLGERDEVRWINDARSSNVGSTLAAVNAESRPLVLILGGLSKAADFSKIAQATQDRLRGCVLFGRDAKHIEKVFSSQTQKVIVDTIDEAVVAAESLSQPGDTVLFSPGCSSYDLFTSYQHRGRAFNQAIEFNIS